MILKHSRKMDGSRILKLLNITQINNLRETERVAPRLEQYRNTTVHRKKDLMNINSRLLSNTYKFISRRSMYLDEHA